MNKKKLKTKLTRMYGSMCSNPIEVEISKHDLEEAFKSEDDLQLLLHNICLKAYGKYWADLLYPIKKENKDGV